MKAKLSNQLAWTSWPKQLPSSHSYYPIFLRKKWKPWSEGYPFEFLFPFFSVIQREQCEEDTFHFNKNWCLLRFTKPAYNSTVRDVRHENERRGIEWLIVESSYVVGFLGVMSTGAPGDGMSMGNMSTHISTLPWRQTNNQLQTVSHHNLWRTSCQVLLEICKYVMNYCTQLHWPAHNQVLNFELRSDAANYVQLAKSKKIIVWALYRFLWDFFWKIELIVPRLTGYRKFWNERFQELKTFRNDCVCFTVLN